VVTQQGTLIMASYMQDQLETDMKRNELVQEGKLSQHEADEQAEEWEKVRYIINNYMDRWMRNDGWFLPSLKSDLQSLGSQETNDFLKSNCTHKALTYYYL
jgi:hypothetical protein